MALRVLMAELPPVLVLPTAAVPANIFLMIIGMKAFKLWTHSTAAAQQCATHKTPQKFIQSAVPGMIAFTMNPPHLLMSCTTTNDINMQQPAHTNRAGTCELLLSTHAADKPLADDATTSICMVDTSS